MSKIVRTGNSLAITIPASFAKQIGIKSGDDVTVTTNHQKGQLVVKFKSMRQLSLLK